MSKRNKRDKRKANKARGPRPLRMNDPVSEVTYANLGVSCMSMGLAQIAWILVAAKPVDGATAYYSRIASTAIACIGLATFYESETIAERSNKQLGGGFVAVNLLDHLHDAHGHQGRDEDQGGDDEPEAPTDDPGGSAVPHGYINENAFDGMDA